MGGPSAGERILGIPPAMATGGPLADVMMAMASALQSQSGG